MQREHVNKIINVCRVQALLIRGNRVTCFPSLKSLPTVALKALKCASTTTANRGRHFKFP